MNFAIVVWWEAIIQAIFPKAIDGDLLKQVHLTKSFHIIPGRASFSKEDIVETKAQIDAVLNQALGKMVQVCGTISRDGGQLWRSLNNSV